MSTISHQLVTQQPSSFLPTLIAAAGDRAQLPFLGFFASNISHSAGLGLPGMDGGSGFLRQRRGYMDYQHTVMIYFDRC
jgi:hypothetical protein